MLKSILITFVVVCSVYEICGARRIPGHKRRRQLNWTSLGTANGTGLGNGTAVGVSGPSAPASAAVAVTSTGLGSTGALSNGSFATGLASSGGSVDAAGLNATSALDTLGVGAGDSSLEAMGIVFPGLLPPPGVPKPPPPPAAVPPPPPAGLPPAPPPFRKQHKKPPSVINYL